jgi:hypothetical protein
VVVRHGNGVERWSGGRGLLFRWYRSGRESYLGFGLGGARSEWAYLSSGYLGGVWCSCYRTREAGGYACILVTRGAGARGWLIIGHVRSLVFILEYRDEVWFGRFWLARVVF